MYADARTAVEMQAPAMKLTMVDRSRRRTTDFIPQLIPLLATGRWPKFSKSLSWPATAAARCSSGIERSIAVLRERIESKDGTLFFDITDHDLEGYNKFVPYYLHPESIYSVGLSKSSFRVKVSVGSNPWAPSRAHGQSGQGLRTLRRRRTRPGGRNFVRRHRGSSRSQGSPRNRGRTARQRARHQLRFPLSS